MTTPPRDHLESDLARLTQWDQPAPGLWEHALQQEAPPRSAQRSPILRLPRASLAAAALLLIAVTIGIALLPSSTLQAPQRLAFSEPEQHRLEERTTFWSQSSQLPPPTAFREPTTSAAQPADALLDTPQEPARRLRQAAPSPAARHIIQRITVELHTDDVRAAFAQALLIPSEARGEYVQTSSMTGEGRDARAELTLRIAADRLNDALGELRELGDVHAERATGEDITTQIVDLDANLRSERRIEAELLTLLDKRADAPLADIMQVRDSLNQVRQRIEQLEARQQHLSRLVSLATVLVILRPPPDDDATLLDGALGEYFKNTLARSWRTGTLYLVDTTGLLITVIIGGLIWWIPAAAGAGFLIQRRRANIERGRI